MLIIYPEKGRGASLKIVSGGVKAEHKKTTIPSKDYQSKE